MTLRRQVKAVASRAASRRGSAGRRVVLAYHSISDQAPYRDLTATEFARHLDFLISQADVRTLSDLLAGPAPGGSDERPQVALTFDDAYADNATVVRKALAERGLLAAFLVPTGFVDGDPRVVSHMAATHGLRPSDVAAMTWDDVAALAGDGHLIGSHTHGHRNLAKLGPDEQEDELGRSRDRLAGQLGLQPTVVAYPYGKPGAHTTASSRRLAARCGYEHGLSVTFRALPGRLDPMDVPRFTVAGASVAELEQRVVGELDFVGSWQRHAPIWLRRRVSPEDFGYE